MRLAPSWDNRDASDHTDHGWTVMGRLRERQDALRAEALAARRRVAERRRLLQMMTAASGAAYYEDTIRARWRGGPTVLAFLFAQPDADAIRALDANGEYFDCRSGDTWDLFFPGYHRAASGEQRAGDKPVGSGFTSDWFFDADDFNQLRRHVQERSEERWRYSGLTDLVLVCGWLAEAGEPTIDWASTISGSVSDSRGTQTLTLNEVIERISDDLESGTEDDRFGVSEVTDSAELSATGTTVRDVVVGAIAGIAAALGKGVLGI